MNTILNYAYAIIGGGILFVGTITGEIKLNGFVILLIVGLLLALYNGNRWKKVE